jgi:glycosyltransferase involved in cell wall biosynthesis
MAYPTVSVIIPTFNRENFIAQAIHSVLRQTFDDHEVIVVDDESTDATKAEVAKFTDRRVRYFYKIRGGVSSAMNFGIDVSRGELIARLDSDDLFLPEKLYRQVKAFNRQQDVGLVYTRALVVDEQLNPIRLHPIKSEAPNFSVESLRHALLPPSQSIMFKKECLERVGRFDETLQIAEDWDFCIRMAKAYEFSSLSEPLVLIRRHPTMLTANRLKTLLQVIRVLERHREFLSMSKGFKWLSPHYYRLGRQFYYSNDMQKARDSFKISLRYDATDYRSFFFFAATLFPPLLTRTIKRSNWIR